MTETNLTYFSFTVENTEITFYYQKNLILNSQWPAVTHMHPLHELFVMMDGEVVICSDAEQCPLKKNEVCILPPRYVHSVRASAGAPRRVALWFTYKKLRHQEGSFDFYSLLHTLSGHSVPIRFHAGETMISMLIDVISSTDKNALSSINEIKLRNIFSLLFIRLTENLPVLTPPFKEQYSKSKEYYLRLAKLNHTVNYWIYRNRSVEELADSLFLSSRQLSNIFHDEFGMSMKTYHYFLRMHRAAYLLIYTEDSISEIAEQIGYASPEIFAIMFKRYYGVTATQYRKRNKKG